MKLMDKLKNALFEEEYVEVEEKTKKGKKASKKEAKPQRKESHVEKPIAKKIVLPEKKEVRITTHEDLEEPKREVEVHKEVESKKEEEKDFTFPMVSDNEFTYTKEEKFKKPQVDNIESPKIGVEERRRLNTAITNKEKKIKPYGIDEMPIKEPEYGGYEKKEEKTYFKPSPIISPIYGILDKNYKKEDVVTRREVRLTSTYARESLNVDEVRNRAYGTLEEELTSERHNEEPEMEASSLMDNDLLDLSESKPEVKKVTMGDAEEYFEDLGLEYNVDYKDTANEKRNTRYQEEQEEGPYIMNEEVNTDFKVESNDDENKNTMIREEPKDNGDDLDEDNLFDLIDSMYEND